MKVQIAILLSVVALAYTQSLLMCYNCNPTYPGNCTLDVDNTAEVFYCELGSPNILGNFKTKPDQVAADIIVECASLYLVSNESSIPTGVFRGCAYKDPETPDKSACDLIQETAPGNLTYCNTCNETKCNNEEVPPPEHFRLY